MEAVFTMCPPSRFCFRMGRNVCTPWMTPHRFTPSIQRQSSSVRSATGASGPMPALLQTTCTAPNVSRTCRARASTLAGSLTSVWTASAAPISAAVASIASRWMSAMTTRAPSATSWVAIPFPIPEAPPVTTATLPPRSGSPLIALALAASPRSRSQALRQYPCPQRVRHGCSFAPECPVRP